MHSDTIIHHGDTAQWMAVVPSIDRTYEIPQKLHTACHLYKVQTIRIKLHRLSRNTYRKVTMDRKGAGRW